eukprot:2675317-Pyramimonas_sp.AAC.1
MLPKTIACAPPGHVVVSTWSVDVIVDIRHMSEPFLLASVAHQKEGRALETHQRNCNPAHVVVNKRRCRSVLAYQTAKGSAHRILGSGNCEITSFCRLIRCTSLPSYSAMPCTVFSENVVSFSEKTVHGFEEYEGKLAHLISRQNEVISQLPLPRILL